MADRRYETLVLIHPEQGEPGAKELASRIRTLIEDLRGTVSQVQEWGTRELAYPVEKQRRAIYVLFEYRLGADTLKELERNIKLMDPVLRFLSVRQDEDAPPAAFRPERGAEVEDAGGDEGAGGLEAAAEGEGA